MDEAQIEIGRFYVVLDAKQQVITNGVVTARTDNEFVVRTLRNPRFIRIKIDNAQYAFKRELTPDEVAACLRFAKSMANDKAARLSGEGG